MIESEKFEPIIVICPYTTFGKDLMEKEMKYAMSFFKKKGYRTVSTYNKKSKLWIDVKKTINPDIVFFTNPHHITKSEYYINNYLDRLTCYVPYSFQV